MKRYKLSHPFWWLLLCCSRLLALLPSVHHLEQVNLNAICYGFGFVVIKGHPKRKNKSHKLRGSPWEVAV